MKLLGNAAKLVAKYGTKVKANSPTILLITGGICLAGAVVSAHRAGRKVEETLDVNKEQIANLKQIKEAGEYVDENGETVEFSEQDYKKEITSAYLGAAWDLTKLYGPVVIFTGAAAASFIGGNRILAGRLAGMAAAYEAVNEAYGRYRQNVIDISGSDADQKYYLGLNDVGSVKYKDTVIDEKTGEVKEIGKAKTRTFDVVKDVKNWNQASPYAIRLDYVRGYTSDPNYNVQWLEGVEQMANTKLSYKGYLTLYDVYDALGVVNMISPEIEKMSHEVGWVLGKGDGDVRFNLIMVPTACGFGEDGGIKNYNEVGLIDFNCIGYIWDQV